MYEGVSMRRLSLIISLLTGVGFCFKSISATNSPDYYFDNLSIKIGGMISDGQGGHTLEIRDVNPAESEWPVQVSETANKRILVEFCHP